MQPWLVNHSLDKTDHIRAKIVCAQVQNDFLCHPNPLSNMVFLGPLRALGVVALLLLDIGVLNLVIHSNSYLISVDGR